MNTWDKLQKNHCFESGKRAGMTRKWLKKYKKMRRTFVSHSKDLKPFVVAPKAPSTEF